jgi:Tol biopolymer transport system component
LALFVIAFAVTMGVPVAGQSNATPTPGTGSSQIAFTSQRDGHAQIYLMASDGSSQVNISKNKFNDSQPAWSPDGTQLAFVSERDGNGEICVMNVDGSNQRCLTNQATADKKPNPKLPRDYEPTWARDGQHIAFVSTRTGTADIWAMNVDGSNQLDLTQSAANNDQPAWSPDLKSIAFVSTRDGNAEICVMDASGFNQRCLTNERTPNKKPDKTKPDDTHPSWSPDSQRIAFVSTRERTRNRQVFVMNADGSNPVNVTKKISTDDLPAWSCDGQTIAFTSNRDGLVKDIYNTALDGSVQARLTHTTKGGDFDPAYQPCAQTGTPTATLTNTPTGTIIFTPIPTDTPTPTSKVIYRPVASATPVPSKTPAAIQPAPTSTPRSAAGG